MVKWWLKTMVCSHQGLVPFQGWRFEPLQKSLNLTGRRCPKLRLNRKLSAGYVALVRPLSSFCWNWKNCELVVVTTRSWQQIRESIFTLYFRVLLWFHATTRGPKRQGSLPGVGTTKIGNSKSRRTCPKNLLRSVCLTAAILRLKRLLVDILVCCCQPFIGCYGAHTGRCVPGQRGSDLTRFCGANLVPWCSSSLGLFMFAICQAHIPSTGALFRQVTRFTRSCGADVLSARSIHRAARSVKRKTPTSKDEICRISRKRRPRLFQRTCCWPCSFAVEPAPVGCAMAALPRPVLPRDAKVCLFWLQMAYFPILWGYAFWLCTSLGWRMFCLMVKWWL